MCFNIENPNYCKKHTRTKMKNGVCHVCVFKGIVCDVYIGSLIGFGTWSEGEMIKSGTAKEFDRKDILDGVKKIHRTINFRVPISDFDVCIEANFYLMRPETKN